MIVDMGINHDLIADFASYAKLQLEDHTEQLKKKYKSKDGVTESFRLKVFNEHLHSPKSRLNIKLADIVKDTQVDVFMTKELELKYNQYIDDFLKRDFNV